MTKRERVLAIVIFAAIVFVTFFSIACMAAQADHDCIGEGCAVCYQIAVCEQTIHQISAVVIASAVAIVLINQVRTRLLPIVQGIRSCALVARKVKLSN